MGSSSTDDVTSGSTSEQTAAEASAAVGEAAVSKPAAAAKTQESKQSQAARLVRRTPRGDGELATNGVGLRHGLRDGHTS